MLLIKLIIVSLIAVLSFSCCVDGGRTSPAQPATPKDHSEKDTKPTAQSNIYRIKRLNLSKDKPKVRQLQRQHDAVHLQQQPQETDEQHQQVLKVPKAEAVHQLPEIASDLRQGTESVAMIKKAKLKKVKSLKAKNSHGLNRKLLNKLGFTKVKAPNSHNRKRLAIESRRHASPDDSHMFIIKLPPNMYYYANPKAPTPGSGSPNALLPAPPLKASLPSSTSSSTSSAALSASAVVQNLSSQKLQSTDSDAAKDANGKKVSFPFSSNGRPGRIYHWNLPVIKKMLEDKQQRFPGMANVEPQRVQQLIDIKNIPTWSKPWENESIEKSYGPHHQHHHHHHPPDAMMSYKKSLKRKSPSYYAPANTVNKNSFNKYFPGNGKPKGFYVIKENQKKPLYYKNIVA